MTMKSAVPMIFGAGPMADAMRAAIAADPDRYRPRSITMRAVAWCPCCERDVYGVTSKATGWMPRYATGIEDDAIVHGGDERSGPLCCCVAPGWSGAHIEPQTRLPKRRPSKRARK
jgi:hypothetical protein